MLEEVKSFLNFTWEDPAKELRIASYIKSSAQYLSSIAGTDLDFEEDQLARDLLFNRVLYMDSHALNDFNENYSGLLNELYKKYANKDNEESESL